jgi:hypothetical protein
MAVAPYAGQALLNLNDPHLTFNPSGMLLASAEDVNDAGWIVGNGRTSSGVSRAYVLIRQGVVTP